MQKVYGVLTTKETASDTLNALSRPRNNPKNRRYSSTAVGFPSVGTPEAVIINKLNIGIRAPVRAHMHKETQLPL